MRTMAVDNVLSLLDKRIAEYCAGSDDKDNCFGIFVADQVLKHRDLSYEQLEYGNTDGTKDRGIDAIYTFVSGKLADDRNTKEFFELQDNIKLECHIFQFKNGSGFEEGVIEKLASTFRDLFDLNKSIEQLHDLFNDDVIRLARAFRELYLNLQPEELDIEIHVYYATKGGNPTNTMRHLSDQIIRSIETELVHGCTCYFSFIESDSLMKFARRSRRRKLDLQFEVGPMPADEDGRSFVGLVDLETYYGFITDKDGLLTTSLFEANVRDWQGDNAVNRQILSSLESRSIREFWWLNNGVTVLASKAIQRGKSVKLQNPSIVNGLQTSRSLFKYFSSNPRPPADPRRILVRIIEVSDDLETGEEIIRATNSQTAVPPSAFVSLDEVHRDIEEFFLRQDPVIYYDRRHNEYKNQGKRPREIMSIQRLTQCVLAAALFQPDEARGRPGQYLKSRDDDKYQLVFNKTYPHSLYYFCASLYGAVENLLRHEEITSQYDRNQARYLKYHLMTHIVLRHLNIPRKTRNIPISLIARQEVTDIDDGLMLEITHRVLSLLVQVRARPEPFRWRNFEAEFFSDLDGLLPRDQATTS